MKRKTLTEKKKRKRKGKFSNITSVLSSKRIKRECQICNCTINDCSFESHVNKCKIVSKYVEMTNDGIFSCTIKDCTKLFKHGRSRMIAHFMLVHREIMNQELLGQGMDQFGDDDQKPDTNCNDEVPNLPCQIASSFGQADFSDESDIEVFDYAGNNIEANKEVFAVVKLEVGQVDNEEERENSISPLEAIEKPDKNQKSVQDDDLDTKFLDELEFTDMEIKCNSRTIHCHKWILACQSSVLKQEFRTEKFVKMPVLEVSEDNLKATIEVLRFLYKAEKIDNKFEAFKGSLLYDVQVMIDMYENNFSEILTIDNVCSFHELDIKNEHFKEQLKTFTNDHLEEIVATKKWLEFTMANPKLLARIIRSLK